MCIKKYTQFYTPLYKNVHDFDKNKKILLVKTLEKYQEFYYNYYRIEVEDMEKQGFTLVELLVVVAIIAVLSIIIIPSVISVNKNINKRMLSEKEENIETAAQLYATKNDDIFNGNFNVWV